jgi:ABC-type Zn uptake system ZnuABC Zn-binding protein ZnuA
LVITRIFVLSVTLFMVGAGTVAGAEKKLKVIASFSILGDITNNVGGIGQVTNCGPNGDISSEPPCRARP